MAEIVSIQGKLDAKEKRIAERCAKIAQEIDPQASGFFRRCLERAAKMGMEVAENQDETE